MSLSEALSCKAISSILQSALLLYKVASFVILSPRKERKTNKGPSMHLQA